MMKETFLRLIQGEARWPGNAQKVWEHAMKIDESDPRWQYIYDESESPAECIRQFCKYFEIPTVARKVTKARRTQVERWTEAIEKAKAQMSASEPEEVWIYEERILDLEKRLAHAVKNNL